MIAFEIDITCKAVRTVLIATIMSTNLPPKLLCHHIAIVNKIEVPGAVILVVKEYAELAE